MVVSSLRNMSLLLVMKIKYEVSYSTKDSIVLRLLQD